jgi:hypothetical protein
MKTLKLAVITNSNPQSSSPESEASAQKRRSQFQLIEGGLAKKKVNDNFYVIVSPTRPMPSEAELKSGVYQFATDLGARLVILEKIAA